MLSNTLNGQPHFTLPQGSRPAKTIFWVLRNEDHSGFSTGYIATTGQCSQNTSGTQIRGMLYIPSL